MPNYLVRSWQTGAWCFNMFVGRASAAPLWRKRGPCRARYCLCACPDMIPRVHTISNYIFSLASTSKYVRTRRAQPNGGRLKSTSADVG